MKKVVICRKKLQYWKKKLCFVEKSCYIGKKVVLCRKKFWFDDKSCDLQKEIAIL